MYNTRPPHQSSDEHTQDLKMRLPLRELYNAQGPAADGSLPPTGQ
jgi:hypothetical protein